jgi:hypothetical protein
VARCCQRALSRWCRCGQHARAGCSTTELLQLTLVGHLQLTGPLVSPCLRSMAPCQG